MLKLMISTHRAPQCSQGMMLSKIARDCGSDHPRVRMNTMAKSEAIALRLQKVCMA